MPWLEQLTAVATGFREWPQQRPDLIAAVVSEQTATLRGSRTLPATSAEIWRVLVQPEEGRRFWTGEGQVRPGAWSWHVVGDGPVRAFVREVTEAVPHERLSLRSVAGAAHHHRVHWQLQEAAGGTLVTYDHECCASHVGLPPVVDQSLDQLEQRLAHR